MAITQNKIEIEVEVVGIENAKNKIESVGESSEHLKDGIKGVGESFKSVGDVVEKSGGLMGGAFGALGESVLSITESVGMFKDGLEVAGKSGARSWLLMLGPLAAVAGGVALLIEAVREFTGAAKEAEMMEAAMSATAGELTAIYEEMAEKGINPARRDMTEFVQTTIEGRLALELLNEQTANMSKNFSNLIQSQRQVKALTESYNKVLAESSNKEKTFGDFLKAVVLGSDDLIDSRVDLEIATKNMVKEEEKAQKAVEALNKEFEFMYPILQKQVEARRLMVLTYDEAVNAYEGELKRQEDLIVRGERLKGTKDALTKSIEYEANAERALALQLEKDRKEIEALNKLGLTDIQLTERVTELKKKQAVALDKLTTELKDQYDTNRRGLELQEANKKAIDATVTATKGATSSTVDYFEVTRQEFKKTLDIINREYVVLKESQVRLAGGITNFSDKNSMEVERKLYDLGAATSELNNSIKDNISSFDSMGSTYQYILKEESQTYETLIQNSIRETNQLEKRASQYEALKVKLDGLKKGTEEYIQTQAHMDEILAGSILPTKNKVSNIPAFQSYEEMLSRLMELEDNIVNATTDKKIWGDKGLVYKDIQKWYDDFFLRNMKTDIDLFRASKTKDFAESVLGAFKLNKTQIASILKEYDGFFEEFKFRVDENLTPLNEYNVERLNALKEALAAPAYKAVGVTAKDIDNLKTFNDGISLLLGKSTDKNRQTIKQLILDLFPTEGSDKALLSARSRTEGLFNILDQIPKMTGQAAVTAFKEASLLEEDYLNRSSNAFLKFNEEMRANIKDIVKKQLDDTLSAYKTNYEEETRQLELNLVRREKLADEEVKAQKERALKEARFVEDARVKYMDGEVELSLTIEEYDARMQLEKQNREVIANERRLQLQKDYNAKQMKLLEDFTNETGYFGEMISTQANAILGLFGENVSQRRKDAQTKSKNELIAGYEMQLRAVITAGEELKKAEAENLKARAEQDRAFRELKLKEENKASDEFMKLATDNLKMLYEGQFSSLSAGLSEALYSTDIQDKQKELESNRRAAMQQYQGDVTAQIEIENQYRDLKSQIAKEDENRISNLLKSQLRALAIEATTRALYETAMGFGALGLGPIGGLSASDHFKSAAIFGAVAAAAGLGTAMAGSPSTSSASTSISPTGASQTMSTSTRETADKTEPVVFNINFSGANIYDSRESAMRAFSNQIASFMSEPRRGSYYIQAR